MRKEDLKNWDKKQISNQSNCTCKRNKSSDEIFSLKRKKLNLRTDNRSEKSNVGENHYVATSRVIDGAYVKLECADNCAGPEQVA